MLSTIYDDNGKLMSAQENRAAADISRRCRQAIQNPMVESALANNSIAGLKKRKNNNRPTLNVQSIKAGAMNRNPATKIAARIECFIQFRCLVIPRNANSVRHAPTASGGTASTSAASSRLSGNPLSIRFV